MPPKCPAQTCTPHRAARSPTRTCTQWHQCLSMSRRVSTPKMLHGWYSTSRRQSPRSPSWCVIETFRIQQPYLSSGSDHRRSHIGPSCGTSWIRSNARMWSSESTFGDRPPCNEKIWFSTNAYVERGGVKREKGKIN